jgi:hypothetical protein
MTNPKPELGVYMPTLPKIKRQDFFYHKVPACYSFVDGREYLLNRYGRVPLAVRDFLNPVSEPPPFMDWQLDTGKEFELFDYTHVLNFKSNAQVQRDIWAREQVPIFPKPDHDPKWHLDFLKCKGQMLEPAMAWRGMFDQELWWVSNTIMGAFHRGEDVRPFILTANRYSDNHPAEFTPDIWPDGKVFPLMKDAGASVGARTEL